MSVTLDLPVPPSVNRTRKIDWRAHKKLVSWVQHCDGFVMAAKRRAVEPLRLVKHARFELWITLSEDHTGVDLDNTNKSLIDYLRHIELIEDDTKKNMRGLHVVWGLAPLGVRVTVVPLEAQQ